MIRGREPFSLADPVDTRRILTGAGFADVSFAAVHEPVSYGPDPDASHDAVLGLRHARDLLDSRAWLITAHRP